MKALVELQFGDLGYIAHPYWPEVEWLVKLEQRAGVHPRHGDDKKKQLIDTYCDDQGIKPEQVIAARKKVAEEHWYRDKDGAIIIPAHQFSACLVQAIGSHPLKKEVSKDQLRTFLALSDFKVSPKKTKADGVYERYVKNPDTNLRRFQSDEFIHNFMATGEVQFAENVLDPDSVESLIRFAGRWTGLGSCRKMGRGKYELTKFDAQ